MFSAALLENAERLLAQLRRQSRKLATAESCTGGLIAGVLTEIPGSSDVVDRGFVTYSNAAKMEMLGVREATLAAHGAVSEPVARAMAEGAIARSAADLAIAVTGVAGPGGGSAEKPVGLVHLAVAIREGATRHQACCFGDIGRAPIRIKTVEAAFALVRDALGPSG
jgi:nicotinamide-nucleotide amidase